MDKKNVKQGFNRVLHKLKVMFKNIWKLIKKPFVNFYKKNKDNQLAKVIMISVVAIIVIVMFALMFLSNATSVVKTYSKGLVNYNVNKMYSVINSNYIKEIEDSSSIVVKESLQESITTLKQNKKDYKSFKIIDSYKLGTYEKSVLLSTMKIYARSMDESKIKDAKRYLVKFEIENDGNITYSYTSIYAVKRGFTWSVVYNA